VSNCNVVVCVCVHAHIIFYVCVSGIGIMSLPEATKKKTGCI
jgi:hypothetical protein